MSAVDWLAARPRHPAPARPRPPPPRRYLGEVGELQVAVAGRSAELNCCCVQVPGGQDLDARYEQFPPRSVGVTLPLLLAGMPFDFSACSSIPASNGSSPSRSSSARTKESPGAPRPCQVRPARRGETMRLRAGSPARAPAPAGPPRDVRPRSPVRCLPHPLQGSDHLGLVHPPEVNDPAPGAEGGGRSSSESATRTNAVVALGSSSVLSRAFAAPSLITPASSNTKTFRADSTGARVAWPW